MQGCNPSTHAKNKAFEALTDAPLSSLMDSVVSPKLKTMEGKRVGARSVARNTLGVEGRVGAPR